MNLKNILTKTIATFMAISIVFGNVSICGVGIANAIAENAALPEIELNAENTKFVKTQTQNYTGLAVQTKVSVNSKQSEETYLPTTSVEVQIKLPEVNSHFPERANVVLAKTMQTTGEKENVKINQNYDKTSGLLTVSYANENEYTKFVQDSKDELEIIYIYSAEAVTENMEEVNLTYNISASIQYKAESGVLTSETAKTIKTTETENKGDILSYNTTDIQDKIYKGFMYSNVENGTKYNTDFKTISTLNVLNSNVVDEITMETNEAEFSLKSNKKISSNGNVVYSATGINKNEFDRILGENGKIEIYQNEEVIATVSYLNIENNNKLSVTYADGSYSQIEDGKESIVIEYKQDLNAIKIKTTKPIAEGNMNFENQATILSNTNYGTNVENLEKLEIKNSVNEILTTQTIMLNEAKTKISVETNEPNFTTLQKTNSNVIVKLDDTNPSAKLFNAPTIKITLPEGIAYGNVSHSEILNGNGLAIKSVKTQGNNVINIELEGKQTEYDLENISGGTSIVLNLEELQYKNTLASRKDKIIATCVQGAEQIEASCDVNIVSKEGVLILSTLNNFDGNNTQETTMENKTVEIKNNADTYEATRNIVLVNNNEEDLTNVTIIEKIGTNSENENSTFVANLTKPVEVENAKVYYSENENSDVNDNTWTTDFTKNAKAYKVELNNNTLLAKQTIIIKEYIQIPGQIDCNEKSFLKLGMSYNTNNNYEQKEIVLGLKTPESEIGKNKTKNLVTLTNENQETIPVELTITPQITQNYVHSNQVVNYTIKVENKSENTLKDVIVKDIIPDNAIYVYKKEVDQYWQTIEDPQTKEVSWKIESLNPNEIQEIELTLKMASVDTEEKIINKAVLEYNTQSISTENTLNLKPGKINITLKTTFDNKYMYSDIKEKYNLGDKIELHINVKNTTLDKIKKAKINFQVPTELSFVAGGLAETDGEGNIIENGDLNNNIFEYTIKQLESEEEKEVLIILSVPNIKDYNQKNIEAIANVTLENELYETNTKKINICKANFEINLTSDVIKDENKKAGDKVTYTISIKNIGDDEQSFKFTDEIDSNIDINELKYGKDVLETIINANNNIEQNESLKSGQEYKIIITGTVKEKDVEQDEIVNIKNKAKLTIGLVEIESNEVAFNVKYEPTKTEEPDQPTTPEWPDQPTTPDEPDQPTQPDDPSTPTEPENPDQPTTPDEPDQPTQPDDPTTPTEPENPDQPTTPEEPDQPNVSEKYSISGIAWVDSNKNGKKDDGETLQHSVVVTLIDKTTGNFALDSNGNKITTKTNNNGEYEFTNITKGNYIVLFEFDTNTFTVTTYKKEGIEESLNSDVILTQVRINGNLKTAAVTDEIALTENKTNINIGLMENAKFDLSLNKYISKISIINKEGTQTEEYKSTDDVAKIDIKAKYMKGTNVIVTYQFAVTNEGDVAGFVDSLQDDLPSGLEFSSDLNKDWYKGTDGKLYTSALSKVAINPNETKEVELVLTKTMTEDNAGIFTNNASLTKISNLANVQENTKAIENNNSSAILAISIKTGSAWLYLGITLSCITIFAIGAYVIKKKVLNENI